MATESEIYFGLNRIFQTLFRNSRLVLAPDMSSEDIDGWDSLKHVMILIAIEEHFRVHFNTQEIDKLKSVGDLATCIERKTNNGNIQ